MTDEEKLLIETARILYPKGTKYHPVGYTIADKLLVKEVTDFPVIMGSEGNISISAGWGYLYTKRDGWAEVVLSPLEEALKIIYSD